MSGARISLLFGLPKGTCWLSSRSDDFSGSTAFGGDLEIRTQLTVSLCRAVCSRSSGFTRYGKVTDAHSVEAWVTLGHISTAITWVVGVTAGWSLFDVLSMYGDYVSSGFTVWRMGHGSDCRLVVGVLCMEIMSGDYVFVFMAYLYGYRFACFCVDGVLTVDRCHCHCR